MKLTLDQALQKGVTAHREGNLREAEKFYRAILETQPSHPDANHNLGVLAASLNQLEVALPHFSAALEANSEIEQFWLSYIDALIKSKQVQNARKVIERGRKKKIAEKKLAALEKELVKSQPVPKSRSSEIGNLEPAITLREVGKYLEAEGWLTRFIEKHPNEAEALSLLSQLLLLNKKEAEAEEALSRAMSINAELSSVRRNQARLFLKRSQIAEALERAQAAYDSEPEDPEGWIVLGACLVANKRVEEALVLVERALVARPEYAEAYASRALIRYRMSDVLGAASDAESAVLLKPHLVQVWQLLADLRSKNNDLNGATEALEHAHDYEPNNISLKIMLGEFRRKCNKLVEAVEILKETTTLSPKNTDAWINFGVALQQANDITEAKQAFKKALEINPSLPEVAVSLGVMEKDLGNLDSARRYFEAAVKEKPGLAQAHSWLGDLSRQQGNLEEAEASYIRAIELKPDFAEVHNNLGNLFRGIGKFKAAEESYARAVESKPDFFEAHNNLGITLQRLGRLEESETVIRETIGLNPSCAAAHSNLGVTLKNIGKLAESAVHFQEAIELNPDLIDAHRLLAVVLDGLGETDRSIDILQEALRKRPDDSGCQLYLKILTAKNSNPIEFSERRKAWSESSEKIWRLHKDPEKKVIARLYELNTLNLEMEDDPSFGDTRGSAYNLFQNGDQVLSELRSDLIGMLKALFLAEIYVADSFFSIFRSGGGTVRHDHITLRDADSLMPVTHLKYSLVYYLEVGDQSGLKPGYLKFYEPEDKILPHNGLISVFPSTRQHSSAYDGSSERVIVGLNFYAY